MAHNQPPQTPQALLELVQTLSHAITYTESSNFETNQKLWDNYARDWAIDADWVIKMVSNLPDYSGNESAYLKYLGEEWSDKFSFNQLFDEFFVPYLSPNFNVAELGSGGGRVSCRVAPLVHNLSCFDISSEMLKKAEKSVKSLLQDIDFKGTEPSFNLLSSPAFPTDCSDKFDFVYAFDVFPHVDLHTQWKYYQEFFRILKPGGRALIHTANLESQLGWRRFAQQDKYSVGGFYFTVPSMVLTLISHTGFKVIKQSVCDSNESSDQPKNMYYQRDYIVVVEKP